MTNALSRRRALPPGVDLSMRTMTDGHALRTASWTDGRRGSILFLNGRGDFIEKWSEAYHDWRDRGFALAAFDWRGQGGSGRLLSDRLRGHGPAFEVWLADLAVQVAWFRDTHPAPHFAVAHSMGGHLLLRHLEDGGNDFERAVLLAPMLGLRAAPIGPGMAWLVARGAGLLGLGERYAPGSGPLVRGIAGSIRQRRLTSDVDRYGDEGWWLDQDAALALGGVTNGWLANAFSSLSALWRKGALEKVTTPLMILVAEHEALVDNAATARAVKRLPKAWLQTVPAAAHELLREADAIRLPLLDGIDGFLA